MRFLHTFIYISYTFIDFLVHNNWTWGCDRKWIGLVYTYIYIQYHPKLCIRGGVCGFKKGYQLHVHTYTKLYKMWIKSVMNILCRNVYKRIENLQALGSTQPHFYWFSFVLFILCMYMYDVGVVVGKGGSGYFLNGNIYENGWVEN